jgi:hypothetical protein
MFQGPFTRNGSQAFYKKRLTSLLQETAHKPFTRNGSQAFYLPLKSTNA